VSIEDPTKRRRYDKRADASRVRAEKAERKRDLDRLKELQRMK
jgi:hypothetical protein